MDVETACGAHLECGLHSPGRLLLDAHKVVVRVEEELRERSSDLWYIYSVWLTELPNTNCNPTIVLSYLRDLMSIYGN